MKTLKRYAVQTTTGRKITFAVSKSEARAGAIRRGYVVLSVTRAKPLEMFLQMHPLMGGVHGIRKRMTRNMATRLNKELKSRGSSIQWIEMNPIP
ncbi:MAG: hypothetical protein WB460_09715 [Candidatus Acidiferrales bacterium]